MNTLKFESFISTDTDFEINQYKILGGIREYLVEFRKNRIYPSLSELVNIAAVLQEVSLQKEKTDYSYSTHIGEYNYKSQKMIYDALTKLTPDSAFLFELVDWALPKIKSAIEEGVILYDFVQDNLKLRPVGLLPIYKEDGYFMIKDNSESSLKVYRFESSLFSSDRKPFRSLNARLVENIEQLSTSLSPESIKSVLLNKYKDLPNPATYLFEYDIDLPFNETLLPVAKRKLVNILAQ